MVITRFRLGISLFYAAYSLEAQLGEASYLRDQLFRLSRTSIKRDDKKGLPEFTLYQTILPCTCSGLTQWTAASCNVIMENHVYKSAQWLEM